MPQAIWTCEVIHHRHRLRRGMEISMPLSRYLQVKHRYGEACSKFYPVYRTLRHAGHAVSTREEGTVGVLAQSFRVLQVLQLWLANEHKPIINSCFACRTSFLINSCLRTIFHMSGQSTTEPCDCRTSP